MKQLTVALGFLFISYTVFAVDLNIGFKNHYEISPETMSELVERANEVAGTEVYKNGPREISADGRYLVCKVRNLSCKKDIPLFHGKVGISASPLSGDITGPRDLDDPLKAPWRQYSVSNLASAHKLTLEMQKYVYEGWIEQVNNNDKENSAEHFKKNEQRTWCMVPWMNRFSESGSPARKGRDLVHGLTKEFPIDNSAAYDNIPFKSMADPENPGSSISDPNSFSSYGVAYFNRPNCEHLINIFGDEENPKNPKDWLDGRVAANGDLEKVQSEYETQDGSVSVKMLFTTLQADQQGAAENHGIFPALEKAYKWVAHVSTERGENRKLPKRFMQKVSHVQMDIAIKDRGLKGLMEGQGETNPEEVIPWVMLTYYFDPNYINPIFDPNSEIRLSDEEIAKAPEGLKHMRPVGIQYGLDKGQSIILHEKGNGLNGKPLGVARNNHQPPGGHWTLPQQKEFFTTATDHFTDTRLNGPADNPRSSCLGCHASAGVNRYARYYDNFEKVEMTPRRDRQTKEEIHPRTGEIHEDLGVLDNDTYNSQSKPNVNVDFNQQIRIGLERYLRAK